MTASRPRRFLACVALAATLIAGFLPSAPTADASGGSTSLEEVVERIGAAPLREDGYTGAGIDVAVIDTGVEPVAGLDGADKVVLGPDLSFEGGHAGYAGHDNFGHGTVMASIIAGNDGPGGYQGVAPGARIVSVKVADNTGAVDVSQVIAALDWVTANGRSNGLNVRVINLSYVTDSDQDYLIDPLAAAVERAWAAGYVVVVAAGNAGGDTDRLGNPAADPYVIAVAAADGVGAADFSNRGSSTRMPDVLAPGDRILGLAAPNSRLVQMNPSAFVDGRYLRGSGTSQATAIVSGAAALLLEKRPELTPDQVKALLILGTVDDKGEGQNAGDEATARLSEYFDLLDVEAAHRAAAEELRAEARTHREQAQSLYVEAATMHADAAVLATEAEALEVAAKELDGDAEDELKDQAKQIEEAAKDLDDAADHVVDEAEHLDKAATELDKDADDEIDDAEKAKAKALELSVPLHLRHHEEAALYRSRSAELLTEAEALRSEAATVAARAAELFAEAAELDEHGSEELAKVTEDRAKQLEDQAEDKAKAAEEAAKHAAEALEEAEKAEEKAAEELAKLEQSIGKLFSNWSGRRLGELHYDEREGAGLIDLERSDAIPAFDAVQQHARSDGSGSLEAARGTNHVTLPDGTFLEGEVDWTGAVWSGAVWTGAVWSGAVWTGAVWSGAVWTGAVWSGAVWTGAVWTGAVWTGAVWSGAIWS